MYTAPNRGARDRTESASCSVHVSSPYVGLPTDRGHSVKFANEGHRLPVGTRVWLEGESRPRVPFEHVGLRRSVVRSPHLEVERWECKHRGAIPSISGNRADKHKDIPPRV